MDITDEIAQALEIKIAKYSDSGLSANMLERLTYMLAQEAICEVMFSAGTMRGR